MIILFIILYAIQVFLIFGLFCAEILEDDRFAFKDKRTFLNNLIPFYWLYTFLKAIVRHFNYKED